MEHLFESIVVETGSKEMMDIRLLPEYGEDGGHLKHYQTLFAFAERPYSTVAGAVSDINLRERQYKNNSAAESRSKSAPLRWDACHRCGIAEAPTRSCVKDARAVLVYETTNRRI
jgi:hypothetical protein